MASPDELLYEYAVVRCVPRIHRDEFLNIGLLMLCKRRKWLFGKILLDEKRLSALDPKLNIAEIASQARIFEIKGLPFSELPVEERYRWLTAAKSAILQTSPSHPGIIIPGDGVKIDDNILLEEFERLFSELVSL